MTGKWCFTNKGQEWIEFRPRFIFNQLSDSFYYVTLESTTNFMGIRFDANGYTVFSNRYIVRVFTNRMQISKSDWRHGTRKMLEEYFDTWIASEGL